ncbi:MAG: tRNA lysidine(34) synthetase TilS [Planctomycetes bacterium]|nr:tRNA lysidine(34) synthetase TilS [Planctomycetota bacterium]
MPLLSSVTPRSDNDLPKFVSQLQAGLLRCDATRASVLVAISGGADSVALLRGLLQLREPLSLTLRAAHLNHQLRGPDADADAAWVSALCQRHEIPCDVGVASIRDLAEQTRRGLEETARDARYEFLRATATQHGCDVVAVAHTADDQAETVLHHILRGTGLTGLRGMEWSRSLGDSTRLIRPMLSIWRTEVERFLADLGQDFRQDATNQDVSLTRNRLRHDLLPRLEQDFNPRVREHLCQLAEQAADCEEATRIAADTLLDAALLDHSELVMRLRRDVLTQIARPLAREFFVRLWQRVEWSRQAMTFTHWDRLVDFAQSDQPAAIDLPGPISVRRRANMLVLQRGL